jgi:hypothetical protein
VTQAYDEPAEDSEEDLRDQAVGALDEFIRATAEARADLTAMQAALEKNRQHLSGGGNAAEMTALFDIPSLRSTLTERLDRFEQARMACRRSLWRMQLAEGTTIADIARSWGLSRQLVSRALSERAPDLSR